MGEAEGSAGAPREGADRGAPLLARRGLVGGWRVANLPRPPLVRVPPCAAPPHVWWRAGGLGEWLRAQTINSSRGGGLAAPRGATVTAVGVRGGAAGRGGGGAVVRRGYTTGLGRPVLRCAIVASRHCGSAPAHSGHAAEVLWFVKRFSLGLRRSDWPRVVVSLRMLDEAQTNAQTLQGVVL